MTWEISVKIWGEKKKPTKKPNQNKKSWSHLKQIMLSKTVVLIALHLQYSHSNCGRWFLFWKSFTRLPSSYGEALLCQDECQRDLAEAGSSWQTSQNRQGQHWGQCLQMITHVSNAHISVWEITHTTTLTSCPDGIFTDFFFFFFWTGINQEPILETGKLHKSQQWNTRNNAQFSRSRGPSAQCPCQNFLIPKNSLQNTQDAFITVWVAFDTASQLAREANAPGIVPLPPLQRDTACRNPPLSSAQLSHTYNVDHTCPASCEVQFNRTEISSFISLLCFTSFQCQHAPLPTYNYLAVMKLLLILNTESKSKLVLAVVFCSFIYSSPRTLCAVLGATIQEGYKATESVQRRVMKMVEDLEKGGWSLEQGRGHGTEPDRIQAAFG